MRKDSSLTRVHKKASLAHNLRKHWLLFVMLLPAVIYVIIFSYVPMTGIVLALWLRSLLVSISQLSKASRNISEGNFDIPDVDDRRQDEMGRLASTFNEMKQSMKGQMDLLREKGEMERKLRIKETEALELQNRVDAGKLQLLRSQIHPHFLFNTLNVISYRAKRENAPETVELLGSLSRFFRYTLGSNDAYVPLSKEVQTIRDFYAIYHARFADRISWNRIAEVTKPAAILLANRTV